MKYLILLVVLVFVSGCSNEKDSFVKKCLETSARNMQLAVNIEQGTVDRETALEQQKKVLKEAEGLTVPDSWSIVGQDAKNKLCKDIRYCISNNEESIKSGSKVTNVSTLLSVLYLSIVKDHGDELYELLKTK